MSDTSQDGKVNDGGGAHYMAIKQHGGKGMTKSDVVDAFIRGDLDRRGFIKRLTAVGVSSAAAMAYAGSLVQSTAAAPSTGSGFITRGFMQDEEYGTIVAPEELLAAVNVVEESVEEVLAAVTDLLANFGPDDFAAAGLDESDYALMQDIAGQIEDQAAALESFLATLAGSSRSVSAFAGASVLTSRSASLAQGTGGTLLEQLAKVAEGLNVIASMYAAVVPAVENVEDRQLLTQMAVTTGRHVAVVSYLAGLNPVPDAFEEPINPLNVDPEEVA